MRLYVETNFILELAFVQDDEPACDALLQRAEKRHIDLIVPAYSLAEPHEKIVRNQAKRRRLAEELGVELSQLQRTQTYLTQTKAGVAITALLATSAQDEAKRLREVLLRVAKAATVLPLTDFVVCESISLANLHGMSAQDALVLASLLSDLQVHPTVPKCFVTKNRKDFSDPDVVRELESRGCKVMYDFAATERFLSSAVPRP